MTDKQSGVASPRIGSGTGYFVVGGVLLLIGFLASAASSPYDPGPGAIGGVCLALAAGCIAVGFWVSLFGRLERRLIDIQIQMARPAVQDQAKPEEPPAA